MAGGDDCAVFYDDCTKRSAVAVCYANPSFFDGGFHELFLIHILLPLINIIIADIGVRDEILPVGCGIMVI